jgi:hypothetical protein
MKHLLLTGAMLLAAGNSASAADLRALPEFLRPDPFGGIVRPDRRGAMPASANGIALESARGGYASCHLVAKLPEGGEYSLRVELTDKTAKIHADLFREWFHFTTRDKSYYPDALIPVKAPYRSRMPEPDNRVPNQTAQAFWLDLWVARDARPGLYDASAVLEAGGKRIALPVRLKVLPATVPDEDAVAIDHNSYGSSWIGDYYKAARERAGAGFFKSDAFFRLIHAHHRIFYEHRGVFHQLGYGHGGKVGPEFAPALEGSGRSRRIASWELFDRHYGPLLDGSAFAEARRGPRPIPFVYLPINPEWPASFLGWGEPAYETEFVNVVSAMERHFREKNWTKTRFEMFFNHKKRYKSFPWDGDETRFPKDNSYFVEYARLLKKAVPSDSPVRFVFRNDASWSMEQQWKELAGVVNFWVVGGSMLSWYPNAPKMLKDRGDILWAYGGTPEVTEVSTAITVNPLRTWMWGADGYVHWLTVSPGRDPWFEFGGGGTALVYPGDRFGIDEPLASVRLKIQRNCLQDLALLDSFKAKRPSGSLRAEAAQRYNGTKPEEWWLPRPPLADRPPYEMTNTDIDEAARPLNRLFDSLDTAVWQNVRRYVFQLAAEEK